MNTDSLTCVQPPLPCLSVSALSLRQGVAELRRRLPAGFGGEPVLEQFLECRRLVLAPVLVARAGAAARVLVLGRHPGAEGQPADLQVADPILDAHADAAEALGAARGFVEEAARTGPMEAAA